MSGRPLVSVLSVLLLQGLITSSSPSKGVGVNAWGTPDNVSSRLQVQVPKSLFREKGYDHREALFGNPPYGGSIAQNVYYTDSDFCDSSSVDPTTGYPTRPTDPATGKQQPWSPPFILMIDRGSCSFVQKVRNAQHAGAAGVIIADNLCLCSDAACLNMVNETFQNCQNAEPIMADDGSGGDITIPAFLMFKQDAHGIIQEVKVKNSPVQVEMSWSLPHPDSDVSYELWTVPSENVSKEFQRAWYPIAQKLGKRAQFTPRQYIYDGIKSRCQTSDGQNMCFNMCTNGGRYCATDPDQDLDHGTTGAEIVTEALRRICVWKHFGEQDGVGATYWKYITEFLDRCDSDDFFSNKDCINDVYKHSKIDGKRIEQCMEDSGGLSSNHVNTLLEREIDAAVRKGVVVLPTMFVNSAAMRGALTVNTVFNAVCAGFQDGSEPDVCKTCAHCSGVAGCVQKGSCTSNSNTSPSGGSVSKKTFGTTLLMMCVLFGVAAYIHWRKTREDMREQVRGILAEYMPLDGGENEDYNPMDFARSGQSASLIS
eukprot:CAMPEP_0176488582 /NCGR_PEP_ID=MMETSP0200_2-20121128/6792_1 /TAXON_ID=947934 /ORGANISM="Chaetoceros sp., Strain GSL56" /LENGTH=538 /DNA_ID=CAMNT_0017885587 /DNA_START=177 /DNA_END=1793 /DNA_ORIENTATION=+